MTKNNQRVTIAVLSTKVESIEKTCTRRGKELCLVHNKLSCVDRKVAEIKVQNNEIKELLNNHIKHLEKEGDKFNDLENEVVKLKSIKSYNKWLIGTLIGAVVAVCAIIGLIASNIL